MEQNAQLTVPGPHARQAATACAALVMTPRAPHGRTATEARGADADLSLRLASASRNHTIGFHENRPAELGRWLTKLSREEKP